jgi:hypothetical protein
VTDDKAAALIAALDLYGVEVPSERREVAILCPVHDESRPSCSFNRESGLLHCMSCGFGGDVYSLVSTKEGFDDFAATKRFVEERLGFSGEGVPRAASDRPRRVGLSGRSGSGFKPRYRNSPVRGRPLSSS